MNLILEIMIKMPTDSVELFDGAFYSVFMPRAEIIAHTRQDWYKVYQFDQGAHSPGGKMTLNNMHILHEYDHKIYQVLVILNDLLNAGE